MDEVKVVTKVDEPIEQLVQESDCGHDHKPREKCEHKAISLSEKDVKALVRSGYEEKSKQFNKAFLLQNIKSKAMVELRACSSFQAAGMIGWRPRHVKVLGERTVEEESSNE